LLHGGGKMNRRNSHAFIPRTAAPDVTGRSTPGREAVIAEIESGFRLYRDVTRPSLHTPTPSTTKVRCVYSRPIASDEFKQLGDLATFGGIV
jgi:hypothetical protein